MLEPATLRRAVEARRGDLIAFASSLVRSPSLPGEEGPVQELVATQLRSMGLETRILPVRFDTLRDHPAFGDDGFTPDGRVDVIVGDTPDVHTRHRVRSPCAIRVATTEGGEIVSLQIDAEDGSTTFLNLCLPSAKSTPPAFA